MPQIVRRGPQDTNKVDTWAAGVQGQPMAHTETDMSAKSVQSWCYEDNWFQINKGQGMASKLSTTRHQFERLTDVKSVILMW